jgi:alpha-beta hydrolase superfamily lysophospholipase
LEPRFAAVAGLGGAYDVRKAWRGMPAIQRRRAYRHTGLNTLQELDAWVDRLEINETLARVHCPALIVHGSEDEIVTPDHARALAAAMNGETQVKIVEGGDHMCTQFLFSWVADYVFDWFAARLTQNAKSTCFYEHEALSEEGATSFSQPLMAFGH